MPYLYINDDEKQKKVSELNENGPWICDISYEEFKKYHFKKNRKIQYICSICNKPAVGIYQYIRQFVCRSCFAKVREQHKDKAAIAEKYRQTCLAKYGVENPSMAPEIKQKKKDAYLAHYGVDHYAKSTESKQRRHEIAKEWKKTNKFANEIWPKIRATWIERYGYAIDDPDFINSLRLRSLEKYGVEYPMQSEACKEQVRQTCIQKYGVDSVNKLESKKALMRKTCIEKYGVPYYAQTDEAKMRWSESLLEHYGVTNPIFSQELNAKRLETLYENYGVENPTYINQATILKQVQEVKPDIEILSNKNGLFTYKCNECGSNFTSYFRNAGCTKCHPMDVSHIVDSIMGNIPGLYKGPTPEGVQVDLWHAESETGIIVIPAYYISYSARNRLVSSDDMFIPIKGNEFYTYHPEGQLIVVTDIEWKLSKVEIINSIKAQISNLVDEQDIYFEAVTCETAEYIISQYYFITAPRCSFYVGVFSSTGIIGVLGYNVANKECHISKFALKHRCRLNLYDLAVFIQSEHQVNRIVASIDYRFSNGETMFSSGADFIKVLPSNRLYHNNNMISFVPIKHFKDKIRSLLGIDYDNSSDAHDNASDRLYSFLDMGTLLFSIPVLN